MDSLEVQFLPMKKVLNDSSDYVLKIVYRNLKNRPVKVYCEYEEGIRGYKFSNIVMDSEKKQHGNYGYFNFHSNCGGDLQWLPGYRHYDLNKKDLAPLARDTAAIGLMSFTTGIDTGCYRMRFGLRVRTIQNTTAFEYPPDGSAVPPDDKMEYIHSRWFKFRVRHFMFRIYNPDGSIRAKAGL